MEAFKVLDPPEGCPTTVPQKALNEKWAQKNHSQSLQRLNERGGLSPFEIYCNVKKRHWYEKDLAKVSDEIIVEFLKSLQPKPDNQ